MLNLNTDFLWRSCRTRFAICGLICLAVLSLSACEQTSGPAKVITIDGRGSGRIFDGIGGVSAGASSRLLIDYPEPYRSQILDYLFKPDYGASLQHLKVEIGSDANSTDGSEPSFARTRAEMARPDFNRGYEWWLMQEAEKRNPHIVLDSLPWGAPGWIGHGNFYSQDMANYVAEFVEGGRKAHDLDIQYTGIWNETRHDPAYVKLLHTTLLSHHLLTRIVCCDETPTQNPWSIVEEMTKDHGLRSAVAAVSVHYPRSKSPEAAKASGKPLWSSEDHPLPVSVWRNPHKDDWARGRLLARLYNLNYIEGRFTATEIWALITSYYDILAAPASGLMYANTPWSGFYKVQSPVWVTAQTTQVAQPGWRYIDAACGYLPGGGTYVTLKSPSTGDYSVIVETVGAQARQPVTFHLTGGLSDGSVHVWETNASKSFEHVANINPRDKSFSFTFDPDSVYSLTTTTGQHKGTATPPPAAPFPFPYSESFEKTKAGQSPPYFADQDGAFEVHACTGRAGRCLEQMVIRKPIAWHGTLPNPYTIVGSSDWRDYSLGVDVRMEGEGEVALLGRVDDANVFKDGKAHWPSGYILLVNQDGLWRLISTKYRKPTVRLASGKISFSARKWHHLELRFHGSNIEALIDGRTVAKTTDAGHSHGMAGVGTGWNQAEFDNFLVH